MKALILNSGVGSRMGEAAQRQPKCMTELPGQETILSRQLRQLAAAGLREAVVTTGPFGDLLERYCRSLGLPLRLTFVPNPQFRKTNYIQSIYCARDHLDGDILLLHGDLVFENAVLEAALASGASCMAVSAAAALPEKDFKAVVRDGRIVKVGVEFFEDAVAAQPLYKLLRQDWAVWRARIEAFCERGDRNCYAEKALNEVTDACRLVPLDVGERLCAEVDTPEDWAAVTGRLRERSTVYMCFSTDILHSGHMAIIRKARRLGRLTVGVLSDEAVAGYRRFPLLPFAERKSLFENLAGVERVVEQSTLSYRGNLERYRPDYVVHGDDWVTGFQRPIRDEAAQVLARCGGKLVEFPYADEEKYRELERRARAELSLPDLRRARLKKALALKGLVTALEAHSGLTGRIVEDTVLYQDGGARQFDAIWVSSLCDSTAKGRPDIELVDLTSRLRTVNDIMEVTSKPVIFDGDTGGLAEHFGYTVRTLERLGVSMVIIEDKTGLKKNSLFGSEAAQTQAEIPAFCAKIRAGKQAQKTRDFMLCARIESLILDKGMEDALERAAAYTAAGADAVMIHSRRKDPAEIFEFARRFRARDAVTPLVAVPTAFSSVTEEELRAHGVNVVIYANQLTRAGVPAMQRAARLILEHHRAEECDGICMPFEEIIRLIPDEEEGGRR